MSRKKRSGEGQAVLGPSIMDLAMIPNVDVEVEEVVKGLWRYPGVQRTHSRRAGFCRRARMQASLQRQNAPTTTPRGRFLLA